MEQPSGGEENAKKEVVKAEAVTEAEPKSSGPDSDPSPKPDRDPKGNVVDHQQLQQPPPQQQQEGVIKSENSNDNESSEGGKAAANKSKKSVRWSEELVMESPSPRTAAAQPSSDDRGSNPYVAYSPAPSTDSSSFDFKGKMDSVKNVLGRWGKKVGEATRKAEDFAGNTWQHLKTGPSLADAALGRIAQGTKVLAEGGYEKIFRQTFETVPEELLQDSFACYLSTSAGPVRGILYVSTAKLAFCSDDPLSYKAGDKTEWSSYKIHDFASEIVKKMSKELKQKKDRRVLRMLHILSEELMLKKALSSKQAICHPRILHFAPFLLLYEGSLKAKYTRD